MKLHKQFIQLGTVNILLSITLVFAFYYQNFEMVFAGTLMFIVSLLPFYLKAAHNVYIPAIFMYATIVFIFVSVFLGQFSGLYDRWHWFDAFLHFVSALAFGLGGFLLLFVYYVHNKIKIPKGIIIFFSFFFCLGVGALWEITEYIIDHALGTNMQVGSLEDTMVDLIIDGVGAFVSIVICSLYISKINLPVLDSAVNIITEEIIVENKEVVKTTTNDLNAFPETK